MYKSWMPSMPSLKISFYEFISMGDKVFRSRTKLKVHNHEHPGSQVFINEDLTARRASLAYTTRQLKKAGKLNDCWTSDGKIVIKDLANKIVQINSADELRKY